MPDPAAPAATVAHALLGSLAHHFRIALGTAMVTRGIVDQGTVDGVMPMAVEIVVGAVIATASTGWGQARAYASHPLGRSVGGAADRGRELGRDLLDRPARRRSCPDPAGPSAFEVPMTAPALSFSGAVLVSGPMTAIEAT